MEIQATIEFDVTEQTVPIWQDIITGLNADKQGAWLEDQVERLGDGCWFGMESLLDVCERSHQGGAFLKRQRLRRVIAQSA